MNSPSVTRQIKRRIRRRLFFTGLTLLLYFSYVLNYAEMGSFLGQRLGTSFISGSLLMYGSLIVGFLALECVFLRTQDDGTAQEEEDI